MQLEVSYLNSVSYNLGVIIIPISLSVVNDTMNENTHTSRILPASCEPYINIHCYYYYYH